jgi:transglutaminase-like putative cysteine protease
MIKTLLTLLAFSSISLFTQAQDFAYGTFNQDDMSMKKYTPDTSAHAVYLAEYGHTEIQATNDDDIALVFSYHAKIKIFDKAGYDQGNIEIPYYSTDGITYETVEDIKAVTTFTDEDGSIKTVELDPKNIYKQVDTKHWSRIKFAMPGIHNGCIIEYSYKLISPFFSDFHSWQFQSNIPKVYSEYNVNIPGYWNYNASKVGYLNLTKNSAQIEKDCFQFHELKCDCSNIVYGISNVPAFVVEDDMTSTKNYSSAINFALSDYRTSTGADIKVAKEWKDVDYELKHNEFFGSQLKRTGLLKDRITPVIAGKTDDLEKAKAIYAYIKNTIKWNEHYSNGSYDGIKKALDNHTGDVGDINLALTTALNAAGLNAEAVLLSTRENGNINQLYPVIDGFDYVIAKLNIGDKSYLLDATDPLLAFGTLPMRCINDQGRVMSLDKPSYWIDMNANTQKKSSTYQFNLSLQPDGKIKGTMIHYSMGYDAYLKRKEIKKFNSLDEYIEDMDTRSPRFKILKSDISGVDSLEGPLTETYEIEIKSSQNTDHDHLSFDPYIINRLVTNPYKLADRTYPVDIGMPSTDRYSLTLHLPAGYVIENAPQGKNIRLPNSGGSFMTDYQADDTGTSFTFSHVIQFNKSIYQPAEYPYLKEFLNEVILSEKDELTFRKKS